MSGILVDVTVRDQSSYPLEGRCGTEPALCKPVRKRTRRRQGPCAKTAILELLQADLHCSSSRRSTVSLTTSADIFGAAAHALFSQVLLRSPSAPVAPSVQR